MIAKLSSNAGYVTKAFIVLDGSEINAVSKYQ